jgi:hypothetical protein
MLAFMAVLSSLDGAFLLVPRPIRILADPRNLSSKTLLRSHVAGVNFIKYWLICVRGYSRINCCKRKLCPKALLARARWRTLQNSIQIRQSCKLRLDGNLAAFTSQTNVYSFRSLAAVCVALLLFRDPIPVSFLQTR